MGREKTPEIWLIEDADVCHEVKTGKPIPLYQFVSKGWEPEEDMVKRRDAEKATLEDLVKLCDDDAEDINAHDFCGTHRLLGAVLFRQLGRVQATEVMRDIAYRRGLHGMSGICGCRDSYKDLDVGKMGSTWDGEYLPEER
jgi:hypothetical protein